MSNFIEILSRPKHYVIGTYGRVGIAVWLGETTLDSVQAIGPAMESASRHGEPIALMTVVGANAVVPHRTILSAVNRAIRDPNLKIACMAVWVEGSSGMGLKHLGISFCLSVGMLKFKSRSFSDCNDATRWVLEELNEPAHSGMLLAKKLRELAKPKSYP